ncbi:MAG: hypothetical protein C4310_06580 [Chloroflexota bacterium]
MTSYPCSAASGRAGAERVQSGGQRTGPDHGAPGRSGEAVCAACHGTDAKGLPGLGKDLTASQFVKSQTDEQLVEFIKKGRDTSDPANTTGVAMPPKGGDPSLTDDQLRAIVAYIRTLQK